MITSILLVLALVAQVTDAYTAFVTGAKGYLGSALVKELQQCEKCSSIIVASRKPAPGTDKVCFDMEDIDSVRRSIESTRPDVIFHLAGAFSSCEPEEVEEKIVRPNVIGTENVMNAAKEFGVNHVVLASSMAAVRGGKQEPKDGEAFSYLDYNSVSSPTTGWAGAYQYSKMKSERRAWEIASEDGVGSPYLTTICPSMIFGPSHLPPSELSGSVSVSLFSGWLSGESRCQSRLIVDVRDVAQAFAKAAITNAARGERLIVSSEVRTTGVEIASWLEPLAADGVEVKADETFTPSTPLGQREVWAQDTMREVLGLTARTPRETVEDMARWINRKR